MENAFLLEAGRSRGNQTLNIYGNRINILLAGRDNTEGMTVFESLVEPLDGPPLHRHHREDEYWYILEGRFRFEVDGRTIEAGAGSSVFAALGTAHTFQNIGSTAGRMITVARPSGLDEFFEELASATAGLAAPDLSIAIPIFERHGLELLGPPLSARHKSAAA